MLLVVEIVRVDCACPPAARAMVEGAMVTVKPDWDELNDNVIVPANELKLDIVTFEVPEVPCTADRAEGLADIPKSGFDTRLDPISVTQVPPSP